MAVDIPAEHMARRCTRITTTLTKSTFILGRSTSLGCGSRVMSYGGGGTNPGCPSSLPSFAATREIARGGSEPSPDPIVSQLTLAGLRLMVRP